MAPRPSLRGALVAVAMGAAMAMAVAMVVTMANGSSGDSGDSDARGRVSEAGQGDDSVWRRRSEGVHG